MQVVKTIKELIENGNIRDQKSFDKWAKSYTSEQRRNISNSINAEDKASNESNDRLYIQTPKGKSLRGRSDSSSSENLGTGGIS